MTCIFCFRQLAAACWSGRVVWDGDLIMYRRMLIKSGSLSNVSRLSVAVLMVSVSGDLYVRRRFFRADSHFCRKSRSWSGGKRLVGE